VRICPITRFSAGFPGPGSTLGDVPDANTAWTADAGATLVPGQPVTLRWDNGKGLTFLREIAVDEDFMFTVTDTVQNGSAAAVALQPYGIVARHGLPQLQNIFVVHEGAVQRIDGELTETDYADVTELDVDPREGLPAEVTEATTDGWIGFTDHYWMTTLVPEQGKPFKSVLKYVPTAGIYQAEVRQPVISPGATATILDPVLCRREGMGDDPRLRERGRHPGLHRLDRLGLVLLPHQADLRRPALAERHIGNMGWAIIALTFVLKILVLPLAYKSYVSMARMKELQPEMEALKERAGEDRQKLQREMMQLYKDKKVNPAAGCLPILIQIPIFFALYKVIFVTIELRHAPFFGWLKDLSAPDPSSLYNLFGLLPWDAPATGTLLHLIFIGMLPILLGITMWLQQKLNPAPTDPVQASIFAWMPWVFMFMLGGFASGPGGLLDHQQHDHLHPAVPDHVEPRKAPGHLRQHPVRQGRAGRGKGQARGPARPRPKKGKK
jgi:YidC/Oxa1 family membrane protein insertase